MTSKDKEFIQEEQQLFYWDLCIYTHSNEGKAFAAALAGGNIDEIRKASDAYYEARNGAGVHYDDEKEKEKAAQIDKMMAQYFHDLD